MPASIDDVVSSATKEWNFWGNAVWNTITHKISSGFHTDDETEFARYVRDNYCALVIKKAANLPSLANISHDRYFWSAVGMSYILHQAGYLASEFRFSEAHRTYIRASIRARSVGDKTAPFWGFRVNEATSAPAVGDLIGYARGDHMTYAKAQTFFDDTKTAYGSHTDVVVAVHEHEIEVIGANVQDSVTKKVLRIGPNGLLIDTSHNWFVVLKRR